MSYILSIETSTSICSVCISMDKMILASEESNVDKSHSSLLIPFIESCLKKTGIKKADLSAIACSMGPGSYTGLRIGLSTAKGLAYGLEIPLIGVNTLESIVKAMISEMQKPGYYMPVIDARRMEVYTAIFNHEGNQILSYQPMIIEHKGVLNIPESGNLFIGGDGIEKLKKIINDPGIEFVNNIKPSSHLLINIAHEKLKEIAFESIAYSEPIYLK